MALPQTLTREQQLYVDLMDEARIRIHALRDVINDKNRWAPRLLQEFAYLQLRILCETIAVCCLIAHGDIKNKAVLKKWRVTDIIEALETLGNDYYPRGIRMKHTPVGGLNLENYNVPQLTKHELVTLWNKSGEFVHRGSFKSLLAAPRKPIQVNLDPIFQYGQKITHLLDQHVVISADRKTTYVVSLSHHLAGGNALLVLGKAP